MTILKTYARLWADDLDRALPLLERLTGERPHLRLTFQSVALGAIGDFLVIAGPAEERAKYGHASATVVVRDLDVLQEILKAAGATLTTPATEGPTGRFLYARHADGAGVEYVEWNAELLDRLLAHPPEPPSELPSEPSSELPSEPSSEPPSEPSTERPAGRPAPTGARVRPGT